MYARPPKESHLDTIYYEIDMLRFCARRLPELETPREQWLTSGSVTNLRVDRVVVEADAREAYVFLEAFLVHFRNLIRFFSGNGARRTDISVGRPEVWAGRTLSDEEVRLIRDPAIGVDDEWHGPISAFLQHCTVVRSQRHMAWPVERMIAELEPILCAFEQWFPRKR